MKVEDFNDWLQEIRAQLRLERSIAAVFNNTSEHLQNKIEKLEIREKYLVEQLQQLEAKTP